MRRRHLGLALALALGTTGDAIAKGPHLVTVHALDQRFDAPERIPSGPTTFAFRNRGWRSHRLRVLALPAEADLEAVGETLTAGGALPPGVVSLGGTLAVRGEGDGHVILALEPGPYALACDLTAEGAHGGRALVHPLEVLRYETAALPASDVTIRVGDAAIEAPVVVPPGPHALRVEGAGSRPHALAVARLRPGRGLSQALAWLGGGEGPSPLIRVAGTAPLSPGRAALLAVDLGEGDYVLYAPREISETARYEEGLARALAVRGEKLD